MNTLLIAALVTTPMPVDDLDTLFNNQQQEVVRELQAEARTALHRRQARFFAEDGDLHHLLVREDFVNAELAAR